MVRCFECDAPAEHEHHVVPRSRGGLKTLPLCGECHGKVHHHDGLMAISRLTQEAMLRKTQLGEYTGGGTPYGYKLAGDGTLLLEEPGEQKVISDVKALRAEGLSLRAISRELASRGITSRKGGGFRPKQIARMVEESRSPRPLVRRTCSTFSGRERC